MHKVTFLILISILTGCNGKNEVRNDTPNDLVLCTNDYRFGLGIDLFDTVTGEKLSVCDSSYIIRDGDYMEEGEWKEDSDRCESLVGFGGAGERAGVYDIQITKAGYEVWENNGVIVNSDECHVQTVKIEAFLTPSN